MNMGLYNMLHGERSESEMLLLLLGLTRNDFYRYRDAWVHQGRIAVYTRGGGGNRDCYCDPHSPDTHEEGCVIPIHEKLRQHPAYLEDLDDSFDNTYSTFYFKVDPEKIAGIAEGRTGDERWAATLKALKEME